MSEKPPPSSRPFDGLNPEQDPEFPRQGSQKSFAQKLPHDYASGYAEPKGKKSYKGLILLLIVGLLLAFGMIAFVRNGPLRSSAPPALAPSASTKVIATIQVKSLDCGSYTDPNCSKVDFAKYASWVDASKKAKPSSEGKHLDCSSRGKMSLNRSGEYVVSVNLCGCVCEEKK